MQNKSHMESIIKLKDIYKALYAFEKQYAEANDLTINEAIILSALQGGEPKAANELYDHVGLSKSRVSRILADIERKGFIVRKVGVKDKRHMLFTLSYAGSEKLKEILNQRINFSRLVEQITNLAD